VFDEAQKIKNPASLVSRGAKSLNADFVLALTGTPIENRLADLWSIADRTHEGFLGDLKTFSVRYEAPDTPPERLAELKERIGEDREERPAFMVRRMKADRLRDLPEKRLEIRSAPMPPAQAAAYREAVARARGGQQGDVLAALQALRAVSLHPFDADAAAEPAAFIAASARWQLLFHFLDEIAKRREKALVFLEAQALQPVLSQLAADRYRLSRPPLVINGTVAGEQRQARVAAFQKNGPTGFDLLILGPRAAGTGLTLTAANHVVHLSRWWNPAVEDQCTDRAYRIGQTRPVTVWIPQAEFPDDPARSFDRQLHELLERKRGLCRDMLAPPAATARDAEDLFAKTVGAPT
jgi:SNF2 family DNA or RNA helicase